MTGEFRGLGSGPEWVGGICVFHAVVVLENQCSPVVVTA